METTPRIVLVLGDSVALSWVPAIREVYPHARVEAMGFEACPFANVRTASDSGDPSYADRCAKSRGDLLELARETRPDVIVLSSAEGSFDRLVSGAKGAAAETEWRDGTRAALAEYAPLTDHLVVLGNPPHGADPAACATRVSSPASCLYSLKPRDTLKVRAETDAAASAPAGADVRYIRVVDWFCDGDIDATDAACPAFAGPILLRADTTHITRAAAKALAPLLAQQLTSS